MRTLHSSDTPTLHLPDAHSSLRQAIRFPPWIYKLRPSRGYCIISAYFQSSAAFICYPSLFLFRILYSFRHFTLSRSTPLALAPFSPLCGKRQKALGKPKEAPFEGRRRYVQYYEYMLHLAVMNWHHAILHWSIVIHMHSLRVLLFEVL